MGIREITREKKIRRAMGRGRFEPLRCGRRNSYMQG